MSTSSLLSILMTKRMRCFGRSSYQAKFFISLVTARIESDISLSNGEILDRIVDYLNTTPYNEFVSGIHRNSLLNYKGSEINYLQSISNYIEMLQKAGHKAKLVTMLKMGMIDLAIKRKRN